MLEFTSRMCHILFGMCMMTHGQQSVNSFSQNKPFLILRPGTALDKEAANRSTTVYLTDRRIDMVPELLSSNLCSLRGGVER